MRFINLIVGLLVLISGIVVYEFSGEDFEMKGVVGRVIDGDTFVLENGVKVRMMGVNTPEKKMRGYSEAKKFMKNIAEGKEVMVDVKGRDKYGRVLGYVFVGGTNLNRELLRKGLANLYYYGEDEYFEDMREAEGYARMRGIGIWKSSGNKGCLELRELKFKESKRCSGEERMVLYNLCDRRIDFFIKDDANHIFRGNVSGKGYFVRNFSCVFNDDGDSVFVWDREGLLIYESY